VILRRRDDYARVLRELGGQLFARKGNVDSYFNLNHCGDKLEDERGQVFLCWLPMGHAGSHENESMEWWNDDSNEWTMIHPRLVSGSRWPSPRDAEEDARTLQLVRITERIREHMFYAGEREAVALRVANKLNSVTIVFEERAK
jgi:hypothetical protein